MKALSIRQPWAWAITTCGKRVENRGWGTAYRGPLAIHAAKGCTRTEYDEFAMFWMGMARRPLQTYPLLPPLAALPRGGIVATARLIDVVHESDRGKFDHFGPARQRAHTALLSPWFFGPYGLVLDDVRKVSFVPYRGALGFFDVPDELIQPVEVV